MEQDPLVGGECWRTNSIRPNEGQTHTNLNPATRTSVLQARSRPTACTCNTTKLHSSSIFTGSAHVVARASVTCLLPVVLTFACVTRCSRATGVADKISNSYFVVRVPPFSRHVTYHAFRHGGGGHQQQQRQQHVMQRPSTTRNERASNICFDVSEVDYIRDSHGIYSRNAWDKLGALLFVRLGKRWSSSPMWSIVRRLSTADVLLNFLDEPVPLCVDIFNLWT